MNLQNNTRVTITVNGKCEECNDSKVLASALVTLRQQGTQIVNVGGYTVTVVVNSNNMITGLTIGNVPAPPTSGNNQNNQGQNRQ
jgi:hypothetical protein